MRALCPILFASATSACIPSIRDTFKDINYPETGAVCAPPPAAEVEERTLYATLAPVLEVGFDDAPLAADCMSAMLADRARVDLLRAFGQCLAATSGAGPAICGAKDALSDCAAQSFPLLTCECNSSKRTCTFDGPPDCAALNDSDRATALLALAQLGEALAYFELMHFGPQFEPEGTSALDRPMSDETWTRVEKVSSAALKVLRCDGSNTASSCATARSGTPAAPPVIPASLALSGGSANGAFTAGYLYELLLAREHAIAHADEPRRRALDHQRIAAVTGTSVGALIAPIVDLYFVEQPPNAEASGWCEKTTKLTDRDPPAPRDCSDDPGADCDEIPPAGTRPAQRCALRMLRKYFTDVTEKDLLCLNDGNVGDFINGPLTSLGAFEPLERQMVSPFSEKFAAVLTTNDVVRVVMSADVTTNTIIGLDERVCRSAPDPGECLARGVLASIPNPLFARGEKVVFGGLDEQGEKGHWLDGGLRSGAPALRAMMLTRARYGVERSGRVLVISTERSEGLAAPDPSSGMEDALYSLGALVHQMHHWETAYANLYRNQRDGRIRFFESVVLGHDVEGLSVASPGAGFGSLYAVFVPASLEPRRLAAAAYQFDPLMMRGLFLWGQRIALDQMRDTKRGILDFLGWVSVKDAGYLSQRRRAWDARFDAYRSEFERVEADWSGHVRERRHEIDGMERCNGQDRCARP